MMKKIDECEEMMNSVTVRALLSNDNDIDDMPEQMFQTFKPLLADYFNDMLKEILEEKGMITNDPRTLLVINCINGKDLYMYVWRNVHVADKYENECYIEDFFF